MSLYWMMVAPVSAISFVGAFVVFYYIGQGE